MDPTTLRKKLVVSHTSKGLLALNVAPTLTLILTLANWRMALRPSTTSQLSRPAE